VWKNVTAAVRGLRLTSTLRFTIVLVATFSVATAVGYRFNNNATTPVVAGIASLFAVLYLVLAGPLTIRNDLRADLAHLSTFRTYPLDGRTVVFAEILSSTLTLTAMQVGLLAIGFGLITDIALRERFGILLAALVILPVVNLMSLTIQNAIALIVPGWVRIGVPMDSGQIAFEVLGQRALSAIASMLLLAIALLPAAAAAVVVAIGAGGTPFAVTLGVVVGLGVSTTELWLAMHWLGGLFDRTDAVSIRD
jgi:hypothetical protein